MQLADLIAQWTIAPCLGRVQGQDLIPSLLCCPALGCAERARVGVAACACNPSIWEA